MLKPTEFTSVQPENRTTLEEALEFAWHAVIAAAERPYPNLKQPQLTHADFVSLLAGERGVLDWQPNDTLTQRRATTDKAFAIHSKAGTRAGLKEALDVLGFESRVSRGELPYSIDVSAEIETGSLDEALQQRLSARITAYKSERDSTSLQTVRGATVHTRLGVLTEVGIVNDCQPYTNTDAISTTRGHIGVLIESYITNDSEAAQ